MPDYNNNTCCCNEEIFCALKPFVGQTVTIFTESGGLSGCGFTGVLIYVDECFVKLLTRVGAAPACPVGSACGCDYGSDCNNNWGYGGSYGYDGNCGGYNGLLGSICTIPIHSIASFCTNAI